eukprot:GHVU01087011.1.p1 GENE.GHVU01087011.1~~GHVU01087011.1.p1  ORF type:complete len:172 (+),score=16.72 GHVU01087011.1:1308-1823(+)
MFLILNINKLSNKFFIYFILDLFLGLYYFIINYNPVITIINNIYINFKFFILFFILICNLFKLYSIIKSYLNIINKFIKFFNKLFKINIIIYGNDYSVKLINNYLIFNIGYSHFFIINIYNNINFLKLKDNVLFFFNLYFNKDNIILKNICFQLCILKIINKYKKKGFLIS